MQTKHQAGSNHFSVKSEIKWKIKTNRKNKDNMAFANVLLHLIIFLHIKLAIMQKPTTGNDNNPTEFNIGGVLSNSDSEDHFRDTIAVS